MAFGIFKKKSNGEEDTQEFIEIDLDSKQNESKVSVKTFSLKAYEDINDILNSLREGISIAVIDVKALKAKDVIELKRAISKIKKTVDALEGSIAGFGDIIIATPSFAVVQKGEVEEKSQKRDVGIETF
jgi:SepF-like predicted cell division protein (DUF552 family)